MHDKDIDALFRGKLEDFEMMPSAGVWNNISAHLDSQKKRRAVPVWGIAASIALLISAGVFLIPRNKKDDNQNNTQNIAHVEVKHPAAVPGVNKYSARPEVITKSAIRPTVAEPEKQYLAAAPTAKAPGKKPETQVVTKPQEVIAKVEPQQAPEQQAILASNVPPETKRPKVVPDAQDVQIAPATMTSEVQAATPVKVIANVQPTEITAKPQRHGVHTLGDLINNVVGSIDKRKDKLIEFTDSDGDQANITGINLGIFKFKKSKQAGN